jgi:3-hydroxyisobutyrate dehydrogenase-like beta-hydroxyacid dehydrogenase
MAARGATLLDAPVSGGGAAAAEKRLLVMVGGDEASFAAVQPVLASYGDPVLHLGALGAGQTAKLLNNLLFTAQLGIATEAFRVGRELGVDPARLARVLASGSGRSYGVELTSSFGYTAAPLGAHAGGLLRKDVGLAAALAGESTVELGALLAAADRALEVMDHPRSDRPGSLEVVRPASGSSG